MAKDNNDRQIRIISISKDGDVKIKFEEVIIQEPLKGEDESTTFSNKYTVESPLRPHRDFLDAMKKLRKHGMDICEMNMDSKAVLAWTVSQIKISGDLLMKQSRVILTMAKEVKRTGKIITLTSGQITMYGDSEYEKAEEMSKLIEAVIGEVDEYLNGKGEVENQLPLFPKIELQTA